MAYNEFYKKENKTTIILLCLAEIKINNLINGMCFFFGSPFPFKIMSFKCPFVFGLHH